MSRESRSNQREALCADFTQRLGSAVAKGGGPRAVAKAIDVSRATVYNWLRGSNHPDLRTLHNLRQALRVDLNWLITGDQPHNNTE